MKEDCAASAEVEDTEHLWIPMPDGTRLAARLWCPVSASERPVPAILEYIPYRKHDMVRARDERNHPYFAAHGYACLRVDMRGSGDSEGAMPDMYAPAELEDARHVIGWIAAQPWCNGRVGMFGTSWGGTASLQASIDAPEALKAIIAVCATHDRYEDDIHHKGGCLLTDTFEWGATLPAILASPPSGNAGPDWRERWQRRLSSLAFPVAHWVREEARGRYWRRGSVKHRAARIACPVLAVGGWSDRYSNSVMSLVDARPDLAWGIVGPWGHHYPDQGHPGPGIGFQQVALEWWDHWLKRDAAPDWPRLRVWLREFDPPVDVLERRNGRWVESGPARDVTAPRALHLTRDGLTQDAGAGGWDVPHDLAHGQAAGDTGYFGRYGGLPLDQRADDARAICFDTAPLDDDLVLYGSADVTLVLRSDRARSQLALRLCDVAPDGTSNRVGLAILNLALDAQLDAPDRPHGPGPREVRIRFHTKAYRFVAGHRLRLSIGSSYWPMVWTPPGTGRIRIDSGRLHLPVHVGPVAPLARALPPPHDLPAAKSFRMLAAPRIERVAETGEDGSLINIWHQPEVALWYDTIDTGFAFETRSEHRLHPRDPLSARCRFTHAMRFDRPDGTAQVSAALETRCTGTRYLLKGRLTACWQGETIAERDWQTAVERRFS